VEVDPAGHLGPAGSVPHPAPGQRGARVGQRPRPAAGRRPPRRMDRLRAVRRGHVRKPGTADGARRADVPRLAAVAASNKPTMEDLSYHLSTLFRRSARAATWSTG
jgi:hypothetical protein